jgi:hypothetical protein
MAATSTNARPACILRPCATRQVGIPHIRYSWTSTLQGETVATLAHDRRVLAASVVADQALIVGCDGGAMLAWDLRRPNKCLSKVDRAHQTRVRALSATFSVHGSAEGARYVASASSDGIVKTWDVRALTGGVGDAPLAVAELDAKARFTCLCAFDELAGARRHRKQQAKAVREPSSRARASGSDSSGGDETAAQDPRSTSKLGDGDHALEAAHKSARPAVRGAAVAPKHKAGAPGSAANESGCRSKRGATHGGKGQDGLLEQGTRKKRSKNDKQIVEGSDELQIAATKLSQITSTKSSQRKRKGKS